VTGGDVPGADGANTSTDGPGTGRPGRNDRRILSSFLLEPGTSVALRAEELGVVRGTISRARDRLTSTGILRVLHAPSIPALGLGCVVLTSGRFSVGATRERMERTFVKITREVGPLILIRDGLGFIMLSVFEDMMDLARYRELSLDFLLDDSILCSGPEHTVLSMVPEDSGDVLHDLMGMFRTAAMTMEW